MYCLARRIAGEGHAADISQEAFLRVWRNPDSFDPARGGLGAYLIVLARGISIDFVRRDVARRIRDHRIGVGDNRLQPDDPQTFVDDEAAQRLLEALKGLSDDQRNAVFSAFYSELTHKQIAVRTGISESTIKSRIRSAMKKMRNELLDLTDKQNTD